MQKNFAIVCYLVSTTFAYFLFMYFLNPTIFYNPIGWLDPFTYVGYGLYYSIPDFADGYYKVSRLPWDLLEYAARHIFNPNLAGPALQLFCFSLMSIAIFFYLQRLISRQNALLLAVLSVFFPIFYVNGGADYHNAISGPLYFLTMALLVASIADRSLLFAGYTGAVAAATAHTNPLLILLFPAVTSQCLVICRTSKRNAAFILSASGVSLAGFACATVALGAIAAAFGRNFFFFMPQLDFILGAQRGDIDWWEQLSWDLLQNSPGNAFLIGIFLLCVVELAAIIVRQRVSDARHAIAAYGGYMLSFVLAVVLQLRGTPTLQPEYYTYMLVAATFTPLGFLLERYLPPLSYRGSMILFALFPIACAAALVGNRSIFDVLSLVPLSTFAVVIVALAAVYLVLTASSVTRFNLALVLLPLLNVPLIQDTASYEYNSCRAIEHLNIFISEASMRATEIAGRPQQVYGFADPNESMTKPCFEFIRKVVYVSSSFTSVAHNYLGRPFGEQPLNQLKRDDFNVVLRENGTIALFVLDDAVKDRFAQTAAKEGIDLELTGLLPDAISGIKLYFLKPHSHRGLDF